MAEGAIVEERCEAQAEEENPYARQRAELEERARCHDVRHFEFKCDSGLGYRGQLSMDGKILNKVRSVDMSATVDEVNEVRVTFVATPMDFDCDGRFVPMIELDQDQSHMGHPCGFKEVRHQGAEEQAVRNLYEKLKARFEGVSA